VRADSVVWLPTAALVAAGVLFLLETAFAVALAASSSLSRVAVHRLCAEQGARFAFVERLREVDSPHRIAAYLARQLCLLGVALCLLVGLRAAGWSHPVLAAIGIAALAGVVLLELCVARVVAVWDPRRALRFTAFLLPLARAVLFPLVQPVHRLLVKIQGWQTPTEEEREEEQEEEVEALIEVGEREGLLEANEGEMMRSIVDLDETVVREIMRPRPDIVALPDDADVDRARAVFLESGHSRLPVYRRSLDEVVGVLNVRDLLRAADGDNGSRAVSQLMREAMFVPESMSVADLLTEMRLKTQMALVVDEYGGTAGLVTLEDALEEIVGEIRDEHESDEFDLRRESDDAWLINASVHVNRLADLFGVEIEDRDFDTVGGLIVFELGRVPRRGETLEFRSLSIEVLEVDRRRIRLVRVRAGQADRRASR